jgi:hypothetical protein
MGDEFARASAAIEAWMANPDARRFGDIPKPDPVAAGFGEGPDGPIEVTYVTHSDARAWVLAEAKRRYEAARAGEVG